MNVTVTHPTDRPNFCSVSLPGLRLWFSYNTVVAFSTGWSTVICENAWGVTTGKHLNWIDSNHDARVPREEFLKLLEAVMPVNYNSPSLVLAR